ncbi:MAG: hypothetical protein N2319_04460 [Candidatus Kapabacteria bacterium]|nr:hypothetical protein [Candidatus Kapabacteria bacterium]
MNFTKVGFLLLLTLFSNEILKSAPEINYFNINPLPSISGKTILLDSDRKTNPALIAQSDSNYATVIYSPSVFNLPEISPAMIMIGNKISDDFTAAVSIYNLGNSLYSDFSATLLTGLNISSILDAGLSFSYDRQSIKNYNNFSSFNINLGFILKLSEMFNAGFNYVYYHNPYPEEKKSLFNHSINIGLGASINDEISLELGTRIFINYQTGFTFSGKYLISDYLAFYLAYSTNPEIAGLAVKITPLNFIGISAGLNYHSYLGFSKSFALSFYW